MSERKSNEEIILNLLDEFKSQRVELINMISDLEELRRKIDTLFPDKIDARYMRFFEEKVKTATSLFNSVLDIRKEINKSLKDEIEFRRKIRGEGDGSDDIESLLEGGIADLAKKVATYSDSTKKLIEKGK